MAKKKKKPEKESKKEEMMSNEEMDKMKKKKMPRPGTRKERYRGGNKFNSDPTDTGA